MNYESYIYKECPYRTGKEFEICPVEAEKQKYENSKKAA